MRTTLTSNDFPAATAPAAPNPAPVFVIGSNMPGYSPDPDGVHALHVRVYSDAHFLDDVRDATNVFVDNMTRDLEASIDSVHADMGANPDDYDPDTDPAAGDAGILELLAVHSDGTVGELYAEIAHGIADAARTGAEYGYRLSLADNGDWSYWFAPSQDDVPQCSERLDYGYCSGDLCGAPGPLAIDVDDVDDGELFIVGTPSGPVGYRVTIEQDTEPEDPRTWDSTAALWVLPAGYAKFNDRDESDARDPFNVGAVWRDLIDEYDAGTAYEMLRLYARLHRVAVAPLHRGVDGSVHVGYPGSAGAYRSRRAGVVDPTFSGPVGGRVELFYALHGEPDGVAAIVPRLVDTTGAAAPLAPRPGVDYEAFPHNVFGAPFDPAGVRAVIEPDAAVFSSWAIGDVYGYSVERVTMDTNGDWSDDGEHVDSCTGYYGDNYRASGLAESVVDAIANLTDPASTDATPAGVTVSTFIGADGARVVQIDTTGAAGRVRVNVNDGAVYDGDPDTGESWPLV